MPEKVKSSWADALEPEETVAAKKPLPPSSEVINGDTKILTEYKYNDEDKRVKVVRTYKIEKRIVSKSIAERKTWPKFGASQGDKPGPNGATTVVSEDIFMQFVSSKEEDKTEEDPLDKLKSMGEKGVVKCRTCQGDHWTSKCPFKDMGILPGGKIPEPATAGTEEKKPAPGTSTKYIPPSMREGARRGETMQSQHRDNAWAIRISNLSESTQEADLEELMKFFGPIQKIFMSKDKVTGQCKGFAYVHFKFEQDAANAIKGLNGHGYDHLILNVDWSNSKPAGSQDAPK